MSTRDSSVLLAAALALVLPSACRRAEPVFPSRDTLVVAIESTPLSFDPRVGTDQASWRTHEALYNSLMRKGEGGEFLPDLAERCESADAVVWRCRLRDGVRFHDGRPLTSADVVFTYRSLMADGFPSGKKEPLKIVREIVAASPRDVEFRLSAPYASFPLQLLLGILPGGTSAAEAKERPVGTGPFRLVDFRPDDRVTFDRFDGHFAGRAKSARLVFRIIPDTTTRALELLNGTIDLSLNNLPADLLPRFSKHERLAVTISPGSTYAYLAFNLRDPVLGKKEVRQALALALDRDALVEGLWRGTVEKTETLVPPGHWAREGNLPPLIRDLGRARALLDAAGYPDPGGGRPRLTVAYKTSTDEVSVLQATSIAEQWKAIGVRTVIRSNDFATFYQDIVKGNFQLYGLRWQGIVDPDHYHEVFLSTSAPPKGWNRGFYSDAEMDRWIAEARTAIDRGVRKELYAQIQRKAADELPYISLWTMKNVAVHAKDLTGIDTINPSGDFTFLRKVGRK
jgi:peptide/nickel transport system substrate-binding protein